MGSFWIIIAALLWATDALVRVRALDELSPTFMVWTEHLLIVGVMLLGLPLLWRFRPKLLKQLPLRDGRLQILSLLVGAGGSALATVLFTAAFQSAHPSIVILLQKLQPIFVVLLARLFLREHPHKNFYFWATIALGAAIVLQLTDPEENLHGATLHGHGTWLAVLSALIWAASTVAGRRLLLLRPVTSVTFWRFLWGAIALSIAMIVMPGEGTHLGQAIQTVFSDRALLGAVVYMAIGPGLIAMAAYYVGLARVSASRVTILELVFPVCAILLNAIFLHAKLTPVQWIAGAVLVGAVTRIRHD